VKRAGWWRERAIMLSKSCFRCVSGCASFHHNTTHVEIVYINANQGT
jgi:hypothetical protein